MVTQEELGRMFAEGHDPTKIPGASNVEALPTDREGYDAKIVGYGHALYALRKEGGGSNPDDSVITLYEGWRGYTVTTSCQLTKLKNGMEQGHLNYEIETDGRPKS